MHWRMLGARGPGRVPRANWHMHTPRTDTHWSAALDASIEAQEWQGVSLLWRPTFSGNRRPDAPEVGAKRPGQRRRSVVQDAWVQAQGVRMTRCFRSAGPGSQLVSIHKRPSNSRTAERSACGSLATPNTGRLHRHPEAPTLDELQRQSGARSQRPRDHVNEGPQHRDHTSNKRKLAAE